MELLTRVARLAQSPPQDISSAHEPALPPNVIKRLGEAVVANAAAELGLSFALCAMAEGHSTREELIRETAYLLGQSRSGTPGKDVEDWCRAERDVDHWIGIYGFPQSLTSNSSVRSSV